MTMYRYTHSHRLTRSRQIVYFCVGLFFAFFGLGLALAMLISLFSSHENFIIRIIIFIASLPLLGMAAIGVLLLAMPFFTKVTASAQSFEYHTPALFVTAPWHSLHAFEHPVSGKNHLIVTPTEGSVTLRGWAKLFQWVFRSDPKTFYVDTAHFSNTDGHALASEIMASQIRQE